MVVAGLVLAIPLYPVFFYITIGGSVCGGSVLAIKLRYTALHLACLSGHVGVIRLMPIYSPLYCVLLSQQAGVSVGAQSSPSGYTALHLACLSGHVGVDRLMLSHSPLSYVFLSL